MIEELLNGPWDDNGPAAPHKVLNACVHRLSDFNPIDGDSCLLTQEPDVGPINIDVFPWDKIEQGASYYSLL